jgi:hypothetical protein
MRSDPEAGPRSHMPLAPRAPGAGMGIPTRSQDAGYGRGFSRARRSAS